MNIDQLMRDANPIPTPVKLDVRDRNLMLEAIWRRAENNSSRHVAPAATTSGRRRWMPVTGLATVLVVGSALTLTPGAPFGISSVPEANAAQLLNNAAGNVPIITKQATFDSFPYVKVHKIGQVLKTTGPTGWLISVDRTEYVPIADNQRVWISETKAERVAQVYGHGETNRPEATTAVWATRPISHTDDGWANPSQKFLSGLPLDPSQLRARLYSDVASHANASDADVAAFKAVTDLLKTGRAADDLRASLYRVVALIPNVRTTPVQDPGLQGGQAFTLNTSSDSRVLVLSPATGELMAVQTVLTGRGIEGVPPGTPLEQIRVMGTPVQEIPAEVRGAVTGPCRPGQRPNGCYEQ